MECPPGAAQISQKIHTECTLTLVSESGEVGPIELGEGHSGDGGEDDNLEGVHFEVVELGIAGSLVKSLGSC